MIFIDYDVSLHENANSVTAVMNLAFLSTLGVSLCFLWGVTRYFALRKLNFVKKKNLTIKGEDLNPLFYIIDGVFEN